MKRCVAVKSLLSQWLLDRSVLKLPLHSKRTLQLSVQFKRVRQERRTEITFQVHCSCVGVSVPQEQRNAITATTERKRERRCQLLSDLCLHIREIAAQRNATSTTRSDSRVQCSASGNCDCSEKHCEKSCNVNVCESVSAGGRERKAERDAAAVPVHVSH